MPEVSPFPDPPKWMPRFLEPLRARMAHSPVGYRLARGAFWSLAGAIISRGLGLLSSILVARMLGQIGWGELGIIQSTVGLFGTFAGFGMGLTATKFVAELRKSDAPRAGQIIGMSSAIAWVTGALMAFALIILAPWMAEHALAAPHLARPLRIAALLLFLGAVNGAQTGALSGFEAFKTIAAINFLCGFCNFPLMVCGVWIMGLEGALWGLLASQSINSMLNFLAVRREARRDGIPIRWNMPSKNWKVLWQFSVPALVSALLFGPVDWICSTLLVRSPNGYAHMGHYNAATQWFGAVLFLPSILAQALLPVLSERMGKNDTQRSGRILALAMKANAAITLPLILTGSLLSPIIMKSYGEGFERAWPTFVVVILTAGLFSILSPCGQFIAASGRLWYGVAMNLAWGVAFVSLTYLMVSSGSIGLASARLGAYALHSIWTLKFAYHVIRKGESASNRNPLAPCAG